MTKRKTDIQNFCKKANSKANSGATFVQYYDLYHLYLQLSLSDQFNRYLSTFKKKVHLYSAYAVKEYRGTAEEGRRKEEITIIIIIQGKIDTKNQKKKIFLT